MLLQIVSSDAYPNNSVLHKLIRLYVPDESLSSGPYVDKEAVVYTIADASVDKYVLSLIHI